MKTETVEERLARLEELFRATMQDIAAAAQKLADRVPEDPRIARAVDDLLADMSERELES